jgi:hypothetical protein
LKAMGGGTARWPTRAGRATRALRLDGPSPSPWPAGGRWRGGWGSEASDILRAWGTRRLRRGAERADRRRDGSQGGRRRGLPTWAKGWRRRPGRGLTLPRGLVRGVSKEA